MDVLHVPIMTHVRYVKNSFTRSMESVSYVLENSEDARNAHRPNVYHARHDSSLLRLENAISVNQRCLDAYSVKIRVHVIVVNSDIS